MFTCLIGDEHRFKSFYPIYAHVPLDNYQKTALCQCSNEPLKRRAKIDQNNECLDGTLPRCT